MVLEPGPGGAPLTDGASCEPRRRPGGRPAARPRAGDAEGAEGAGEAPTGAGESTSE